MERLVKKIKINTTVKLITGLHIGGSSDNVEIGGIDNPVIKVGTKQNQPYIPGSSLKGKMRCLLEQIDGASKVGGSAKVSRLFGSADAKHPQPSKLLVRDAYLTEKSEELLRNTDTLEMPYTENKYENVIDRIKGTAEHPRQTERVPAGAEFNVEFIINVWDDDNENEFVDLLKKAMAAVENDYLGGSGSRGYGQIEFGEIQQVELNEANGWKA